MIMDDTAVTLSRNYSIHDGGNDEKVTQRGSLRANNRGNRQSIQRASSAAKARGRRAERRGGRRAGRYLVEQRFYGDF